MEVLGERVGEMIVKALVCGALDASVSSSDNREKLKVSKQRKRHDRDSIWKINLMKGCRIE